MSKARLVITAVVIEGRSQAEVARAYGISQPWISRLVVRWRTEGEAAYEPRSRRPHRSPVNDATPTSVATGAAQASLRSVPVRWFRTQPHDPRVATGAIHHSYVFSAADSVVLSPEYSW